jgi:exopolysaccharide biosynthesis polyprenyl glycosylphosphotransferase
VFSLTPKTNLVLFTGIFGVIDFYLRILIKRYFATNGISRKIIIVSEQNNSLISELEQNQNIGYQIIKETNNFDLNEIVSLNPDAVVVSTDKEIELEKIYTIIKKGIFVYTIKNFYEEVFQKVPTETIDKDEILDYISKNRTVFNFIKRGVDIILALILLIALSPVLMVVYFFIKISSKGPGLFPHKRVTLDDKEFEIYKFRSMYIDAEKNGVVWTKNNNADPRITPFGRFIRKTHLDEIPQLLNILKGDLSFVGPRPERPEFISKLKKDILYYNLRHSVKAGLTGWAQVNYKYGSSIDDAREKLKYDFYYMKNKNIFFDFLIILKTIAEIFRY